MPLLHIITEGHTHIIMDIHRTDIMDIPDIMATETIHTMGTDLTVIRVTKYGGGISVSDPCFCCQDDGISASTSSPIL